MDGYKWVEKTRSVCAVFVILKTHFRFHRVYCRPEFSRDERRHCSSDRVAAATVAPWRRRRDGRWRHGDVTRNCWADSTANPAQRRSVMTADSDDVVRRQRRTDIRTTSSNTPSLSYSNLTTNFSTNPFFRNAVASIPPNIESKSGSPPSWSFLFPHVPQLPSKIYLGKMQMSKCIMTIGVTTTRIVSNKWTRFPNKVPTYNLYQRIVKIKTVDIMSCR